MKKLFLIAASMCIVAVMAAFVVMPSHAVKSSGNSDPSVAPAIPDSVGKVLQKSCYPCHSEPGKGMALSKLNFDKWGSYKPEKQADKAKAICKQLTKGSMPPKSFRGSNPDKVPTQAEVKTICNWAASFPAK